MCATNDNLLVFVKRAVDRAKMSHNATRDRKLFGRSGYVKFGEQMPTPVQFHNWEMRRHFLVFLKVDFWFWGEITDSVPNLSVFKILFVFTE